MYRAFTGESMRPPATSQSELGDFLRSRRGRLTPKNVGLRVGPRRRTPGLRREEVAELAGIGVDWYIRLEQGRAVSPSVTTVDALARALKLSATEHAHLRALTRRTDRRAFVRETVPDNLRRLIESLNQPTYITGRRWDVLAWNTAADAVFGFSQIPDDERNTLLRMMTDARTKRLFGKSWENEARRMVAQFRGTHDLWADDPAFVELVAKLRAGSREFPTWWEAHDIRNAVAGQKQLKHPRMGALSFEYATFQSNDDPTLKIAIYTPISNR